MLNVGCARAAAGIGPRGGRLLGEIEEISRTLARATPSSSPARLRFEGSSRTRLRLRAAGKDAKVP